MTTDDRRVRSPALAGCLAASPRGALLAVKVYPGSSRSRLEGISGSRLSVRVHSRPEKDRANREALSLISRILDVPASRLEIVHGRSSREKTVLLHGLEVPEVEARLSAILAVVHPERT